MIRAYLRWRVWRLTLAATRADRAAARADDRLRHAVRAYAERAPRTTAKLRALWPQ